MENPALPGAFPTAFQEPRKRLPPVQEAREIPVERNLRTTTKDEDGGTIKTHQLISMFQHRKQISSPHASPNRTESTAAASSFSRTPDDSGNDDDNNNSKGTVLFLGSMHRTESPSLPLLPQSSGHPFLSSNDTSKSAATSSDDSSVSTISAETGESFQRGGFRPLTPDKSSPPPRGTPTRQDTTTRSTDGHAKEKRPRNERDSRQGNINVRTDMKVDLFREEESSDVLRLKTRLATMEKIMSTLQGELRRRAEKNLVQSTRKVTKKKNLRISAERNECLVLLQDDESLSSVPKSESSRSEDPLVSQLAGIVEKLPREDKVTLLLNLSSKEDSWDIKSARVKKADRRLDYV